MRNQQSKAVSSDGTELIRRHAPWLAPLIALMQGVFIQGLVPGYFTIHSVLTIASFFAGLWFRWTRRASWVIGGNLVMTGLFGVYLFGILAPLSYLARAGHRTLLVWTAPSVVVGLGAFLVWRTRVSLTKEWAQPLEQCPGVHVGSAGTIVYERVIREQPISVALACVLLVIYVPVLYIARDSPAYLPLAIVVGPAFIAFLAIDPLGYLIAFYVSIRRWERANDLRLYFPPLRTHRGRQRSVEK